METAAQRMHMKQFPSRNMPDRKTLKVFIGFCTRVYRFKLRTLADIAESLQWKQQNCVQQGLVFGQARELMDLGGEGTIYLRIPIYKMYVVKLYIGVKMHVARNMCGE